MRFSSKTGIIAFLSSIVFVPVSFQAESNKTDLSEPYRLHLVHLHTGEHLDIIYRQGDRYIPSALQELNHFLRDHRTGDVHEYDPRVFDLLASLTQALAQPDAEIDIVCGYRTPQSNQYLRRHSPGVAEHSLHIQAKAIDIRIPGVSSWTVRKTALALARGGVGYYSRSNFVHVDVGRVRHWEFPSIRQTGASVSTHTLN
jgi:uncharacterized protein YcbK (DUF882 family)